MKTLALLLVVSLGIAIGVKLEADTHALHVARVTGVSYVQIIQRSTGMWIRELHNLVEVK